MNLSTVYHHGYTTEKPNAGMISLCTLINLSTQNSFLQIEKCQYNNMF
jgi:hypothetical protein